MRQTLIPVLILATVALSSSNVLPLSMNHLQREPAGSNGQHDNILSDRYQTRNILDDLFYKIYVEHQNRRGISEADIKYASMDEDDDIFSILNSNDNYNGEGFRKAQWHNYPRQMDRLHELFDEDKRNFNQDPRNEALVDETAPDNPTINDITNELHENSNADTNNIYDPALAANQLLILKIRLACLKDINKKQYADMMSTKVENSGKVVDNDEYTNENPSMNIIKVKREGVSSSQDEIENPTTESKAVKKRIFSLWTRLQSLNHKGHELHHRRHLHAFYGLPDSDGGGRGVLTAEPRAILMRPPGSPLRWG